VFKDVGDLDEAITGAANAIFFNHGQCCCAGSRLMVEKPIFDKVVDGIAERAKKIKLGTGLANDTQMGPLGFRRAVQSRDQLHESGQTAGGLHPADRAMATWATSYNPRCSPTQDRA
jgi:phenylacetaldehyde dehydrogenase